MKNISKILVSLLLIGAIFSTSSSVSFAQENDSSVNSTQESNQDENQDNEVVYLGYDLPAFNYRKYYFSELEKDSNQNDNIFLAGDKYNKGVRISSDTENRWMASYNLAGKYSSLKGILGIEDHMEGHAIITFIGDGEILKDIEVQQGNLPVEFEIDVEDIKELKIEATSLKRGGDSRAAIGDFSVE